MWILQTSHISQAAQKVARVIYWLVVWTPLKNISQLGWLFPIYGKIKLMFQTTNQYKGSPWILRYKKTWLIFYMPQYLGIWQRSLDDEFSVRRSAKIMARWCICCVVQFTNRMCFFKVAVSEQNNSPLDKLEVKIHDCVRTTRPSTSSQFT